MLEVIVNYVAAEDELLIFGGKIYKQSSLYSVISNNIYFLLPLVNTFEKIFHIRRLPSPQTYKKGLQNQQRFHFERGP